MPLEQEYNGTSRDKTEQQNCSALPNLSVHINQEKFLEIVECYTDNFAEHVQTDSENRLRYITRGILCGIKSVFLNSISVKKLKTEII